MDRIDATDPADCVAELRATIDARIEANHRIPDAEVERELIGLRHELGSRLRQSPADPPNPSRTVAVDPGRPFPPEVDGSDLTGQLPDALADSTCVIVRGLIDDAGVAMLRDRIDRAFSCYDDRVAGGEGPDLDPWYRPFCPTTESARFDRAWLRAGGGVLGGDSPRTFAELVDLYQSIGLIDAFTHLYDERPVTSLDKCTLRRVHLGQGIEWHQDGSFLGAGLPATNVWLSLSPTPETPGLELVGPLGHIVETGTGGANYDWSVGPEVVDGLAPTHPVVRPWFVPGDALVFNGYLLHRTAPEALTPDARYAIETWFFSPSQFPDQQHAPLAL